MYKLSVNCYNFRIAMKCAYVETSLILEFNPIRKPVTLWNERYRVTINNEDERCET